MALGELIVAVVVLGTSVTGQPEGKPRAEPAQTGARSYSAEKGPGSGAVAPGRVVVTAVEPPGPGGSELGRESLQAALERGLAAAGLEVLSHARTHAALTRHPELRRCQSAACRAKLGRILDVPLCAQVRAQGDQRQLDVTVTVFQCAKEAPLASKSRQCRAGTGGQAEEAVSNLADEVGRAAASQLALAQEGAGKEVGTRSGDSPPGDGKGSRRFVPEEHRRPLIISGLTLASVGLVATVVGSVVWALHGKVRSEDEDTLKLYQTRVGGVTTTSLGLAALLSGTVMAVIAWRSAPRSGQATKASTRAATYGVTVDPGRGVVGIWGQF